MVASDMMLFRSVYRKHRNDSKSCILGVMVRVVKCSIDDVDLDTSVERLSMPGATTFGRLQRRNVLS